jgi:hypothetical protein
VGVQNLLGDAGACPEVELNGKAWKIGHPTQRAKAALEELAAAKAVSEVVALKGVVPPAAYAEMFADVMRGIKTGAYKTFSPGWVEQATGPAGGALFLLSLLRERHPEATEEDAVALAAAKPDEVQAALARVLPPFFEALLATAPIPAAQKGHVLKVLADAMADFLTPQTPTSSPPPGSS